MRLLQRVVKMLQGRIRSRCTWPPSDRRQSTRRVEPARSSRRAGVIASVPLRAMHRPTAGQLPAGLSTLPRRTASPLAVRERRLATIRCYPGCRCQSRPCVLVELSHLNAEFVVFIPLSLSFLPLFPPLLVFRKFHPVFPVLHLQAHFLFFLFSSS